MTPKFKLKLMIPVLIVSCITFLRIGMQHWTEAAVEEPVNCAAFKIDPIIGLHSSRLSRQQVLAKLHFHKQQMKHQIVRPPVRACTFLTCLPIENERIELRINLERTYLLIKVVALSFAAAGQGRRASRRQPPGAQQPQSPSVGLTVTLRE
jgi:hypothetical protein